MLVRWSVIVVPACTLAVLTGCCCEKKKQEAVGVTEAGYPAYVAPQYVPPMLTTISERSEDVIQAASEEDWPRVFAYVRDISDAWADYQHPTVVPLTFPRPPGSILYGDMSAAVTRLQEASAARKATETMRAANDVEAAAADLQEYYHPAVPPDLHRLRTLERRIVLDAAEGRLDNTFETLSKARSVWLRVRPVVEINSSPTVVATVDERLDAQQAALDVGNSAALGAAARQTIDLVREMERLTY